ncbi:MAG TPA: hypothetical protein VLG41_02530 [Hydrogenophaga sp.]|uniref:hypothetical protein n=1 Tax=Hydrogenophaga sp. TaxID=1904254 RepID=UPI002CA5932E|nr:hypothetical protein [Hydrogenophaga sp.]HSX91767.1 hypothetical protein [Hydrogenophaga sp.]
MFKSSGRLSSSGAQHAQHTRCSPRARAASEPFCVYETVLSETCKRFPKAWSTALRTALSDYFEGETRLLNLSALPRGCLFAAKDVLDAFCQACDALDLQPLELHLSPALRYMPEWVNQCPLLRTIVVPKFAGRELNFTALPHLSTLTLTGIPENARHRLTLHLQKGCFVDGVLANGNKAEWTSTLDPVTGHVSMTLSGSAWENPSGQVAWNETEAWAAANNPGLIQRLKLFEGVDEIKKEADKIKDSGVVRTAKIVCRHIALAITQAWAAAKAKGEKPHWVNTPSAIAREVSPVLEGAHDDIVARPANAAPVALSEWPRFMKEAVKTMKAKGEDRRYALLITANHTLPLMLDRSGPHTRLIFADPNLEHQTELRAPFPFERVLYEDDPQLYLKTSPTQILLPPDGPSSPRQAVTINPNDQAGHVMVIWLRDPLDLEGATVDNPRDAEVDTSYVGQTPTPGLLHDMVRLGAKPDALSKTLSTAIESCGRHDTPSRSFLELFASFSKGLEGYEGHDPLLATAFKRNQRHLVKPLGDALVSACERLALSDEDMFVCLTAAGGSSPSPLSFILNSDAGDALPSFGELLLTLWKRKALSNDTLRDVLRVDISNSNSNLSEAAIQRFKTLVDTLVEEGALAREQADSLRLQADKGPRTRVKNSF